jgi:predicted RNase H-like HicB family nuclease
MVRASRPISFRQAGVKGMAKTNAKTTKVTFHVTISEDSDGSYWAKVDELPGCFASGLSLDEIKESTFDAIQLWLPEGIELGDLHWEFEQDPPRHPQGKEQRASRAKPRRALVCA